MEQTINLPTVSALLLSDIQQLQCGCFCIVRRTQDRKQQGGESHIKVRCQYFISEEKLLLVLVV